MSSAQLIEEVHLSVYVPRGLPEAEYEAVLQTLDDARFQARLRRAVRHVVFVLPVTEPGMVAAVAVTTPRRRRATDALHGRVPDPCLLPPASGPAGPATGGRGARPPVPAPQRSVSFF
jgi:hypothetical protein